MSEKEYRKELEILQSMVDAATRDLDTVAQRLGNGAVLKYPGEFKDPELEAMQRSLTSKIDRLLDKMQALHADYNAADKG